MVAHADAVIITPVGSCNAEIGRVDLQAKCLFPDGSHKTIGILGICKKKGFEENVWKSLLQTMKDQSGKCTKGSIIALRDELLASEGLKHGKA